MREGTHSRTGWASVTLSSGQGRCAHHTTSWEHVHSWNLEVPSLSQMMLLLSTKLLPCEKRSLQGLSSDLGSFAKNICFMMAIVIQNGNFYLIMLNPGHPLSFLATLWVFWFCLWWCKALSRCGLREGPSHLGLPSSWDQLLLGSIFFPLIKSLLLSWSGHLYLRWILSAERPPEGIHKTRKLINCHVTWHCLVAFEGGKLAMEIWVVS